MKYLTILISLTTILYLGLNEFDKSKIRKDINLLNTANSNIWLNVVAQQEILKNHRVHLQVLWDTNFNIVPKTDN